MADSRAARDNGTRFAQPASSKRSQTDRIHLPGEFIDPPYAVALDDLAGRIERQAVQPARASISSSVQRM